MVHPLILEKLEKHKIHATFFWTGHAAENNPGMVRQVRDAGHETGCHGLYHETLGDPIFPYLIICLSCHQRWRGDLLMATKIVKETSGLQPLSFRSPRLWAALI